MYSPSKIKLIGFIDSLNYVTHLDRTLPSRYSTNVWPTCNRTIKASNLLTIQLLAPPKNFQVHRKMFLPVQLHQFYRVGQHCSHSHVSTQRTLWMWFSYSRHPPWALRKYFWEPLRNRCEIKHFNDWWQRNTQWGRIWRGLS